MGFTIATYSLYGLPPLPNIYVSCKGSYQIKKQSNWIVCEDLIEGKQTDCYVIIFTTYFQASNTSPAIQQKEMCFSIDALPRPADLYSLIYDDIKKKLNTNDNLVFVDDL